MLQEIYPTIRIHIISTPASSITSFQCTWSAPAIRSDHRFVPHCQFIDYSISSNQLLVKLNRTDHSGYFKTKLMLKTWFLANLCLWSWVIYASCSYEALGLLQNDVAPPTNNLPFIRYCFSPPGFTENQGLHFCLLSRVILHVLVSTLNCRLSKFKQEACLMLTKDFQVVSKGVDNVVEFSLN